MFSIPIDKLPFHKSSVNCTRDAIQFPVPFFVFGEKIRTRAVSCKSMTMVSPLHLMLFASRKIELLPTGNLPYMLFIFFSTGCSILLCKYYHFDCIFKGQLISEWNFGVFKSPKKPTKFHSEIKRPLEDTELIRTNW